MTEIIEDMEDSELSNSVIKTPGILLREARQAKKLKREDVAKQMHLSVQWVKNLEKDDYSQVPALIYVRGYLRAYARCVGLNPEEVISAFEDLALNDEFERIKSREQTVKHQVLPVISSNRVISRKTVRWITFFTLVVLIILIGIWWQEKKHFVFRIQAVMQSTQELPLKETSKGPISTDAGKTKVISGTDH